MKHYFVEGRVQGVFFRASTKKEADALGIKGFVRNLSDGRVEVHAVGEEKKLEAFKAWLQKGPMAASVTKLDEISIEGDEEYTEFSIWKTV